jgi:AcrR family transcriptional regulator
LITRNQKINRKSTSRSRKSSAKRESIISAAIEVINAKSYALASMTEIAAALGLRDATPYYYFRNKRAADLAGELDARGGWHDGRSIKERH